MEVFRLAKFCKSKFIYFLLFIFVFASYFSNFKNSAPHSGDEFKTYQNKTYNPGCPGLSENEWRIFKELTTPNILVSDKERAKLGIEDLGFVTFTSKNHMKEAM